MEWKTGTGSGGTATSESSVFLLRRSRHVAKLQNIAAPINFLHVHPHSLRQVLWRAYTAEEALKRSVKLARVREPGYTRRGTVLLRLHGKLRRSKNVYLRRHSLTTSERNEIFFA